MRLPGPDYPAPAKLNLFLPIFASESSDHDLAGLVIPLLEQV